MKTALTEMVCAVSFCPAGPDLSLEIFSPLATTI